MEPEVKEKPENIETKVQEWSKVRSELQELAAKSKDITINGHVDGPSAGYKVVKAFRIDLKNQRVAIDKKREALKAGILAAGRMVESTAKELTAIITPEEDRLKAMEDEYDAEQERIKQAAKEAAAKKLQDRIDSMNAVQAPVNLLVLQTQTDEQFAATLEQATFEFNEKARKDQEEKDRLAQLQKEEDDRKAAQELADKAKAEEDRLAKEKADLEAAEKLRKEQEELDRKQAEIKKQEEEQREAKEKLDRERRELEEEKNRLAEEKETARLAIEKTRNEKLQSLRFNGYVADLGSRSESDWLLILADAEKAESDRKAQEKADHEAELNRFRLSNDRINRLMMLEYTDPIVQSKDFGIMDESEFLCILATAEKEKADRDLKAEQERKEKEEKEEQERKNLLELERIAEEKRLAEIEAARPDIKSVFMSLEAVKVCVQEELKKVSLKDSYGTAAVIYNECTSKVGFLLGEAQGKLSSLITKENA